MGLRIMHGSLALLDAAGRVDAFYEIGFGGCWDVAAGALLVQEAGGAVLDPAGGPLGLMSRRVLAATPALAPKASMGYVMGSTQAEHGIACRKAVPVEVWDGVRLGKGVMSVPAAGTCTLIK